MKLPPGHIAGQGVVRPTGYGGFGERLMRGMGWQAGQGLGKTGDGIKEAIQVAKKEDNVGVSGTGCDGVVPLSTAASAVVLSSPFLRLRLRLLHSCSGQGCSWDRSQLRCCSSADITV